MTPIQQAMIDLQQQIYDSDYFLDTYDRVVKQNNMFQLWIGKGSYPDDTIIMFCNNFWLALPDSPSIRRQPFFALCDIAEKCFDEGEEE